MIGDSTYDMIMTRAADAIPLGVSWGYHAPERLREAGAAAILADFRELNSDAGRGLPAPALNPPARATQGRFRSCRWQSLPKVLTSLVSRGYFDGRAGSEQPWPR